MPTATPAAIGAAGAIGSALINRGSGGSGSSSTSSSQPWAGVADYLTGPRGSTGHWAVGADGRWERQGDEAAAPGLYPEAAQLYTGQGWTAEMQAILDAQNRDNTTQLTSQAANARFLSDQVQAGQFDPNYTPVAQGTINQVNPVATADPTMINPQSVVSGQIQNQSSANPMSVVNMGTQAVNPNAVNASGSSIAQGRADQGVLNPTGSLSRLLSGQVDNPQLQGMHQAILNDSSLAYNDMLRNLQTSIMPDARNEAVAAGQYGSSRQGIAEGLIGEQAARNARDLAIQGQDAGVNLYGNAYEAAQNRMDTTANTLNTQGTQNQQFNANQLYNASNQNAANALTAGIFNSGQLSNNAQFDVNSLLNNNQFNVNNALGTQQQNIANNLNTNQFNSTLGAAAQTQNAANLMNNNQYNATNNMTAQDSNIRSALDLLGINSNIGLQNNVQGAANSATQLQNQLTAGTVDQGANSITNQLYNSLFSNLQAPNQYQWNQLGNYAGIIQPGTQIGGSTTGTNQYNPGTYNTIGALGGAATDLISALGNVNWGGGNVTSAIPGNGNQGIPSYTG